MVKLIPGERICILVNGEPVDTVVDDRGTQRFIENEVTVWLFETGQLDLAALYYAFSQGVISLESYMEFYMSLGYTLGGFEEIFGEGSGVADITGYPCEILNPAWGREEVTVH
jgi:hypothetical protein